MTGLRGEASEGRLLIEPMRPDDLAEVLAIEVTSFSLPWTAEMFRGELTEDGPGMVLVGRLPGAGTPPSVAGYICVWLIGDELHVNNLAVHPRWRNRGIGRELLEAGLAEGRRKGARVAFLEVRVSNATAQHLYRQCAFEQVGIRPRYYTHPVEDAVIMRRSDL